jgi:hypothetical protein
MLISMTFIFWLNTSLSLLNRSDTKLPPRTVGHNRLNDPCLGQVWEEGHDVGGGRREPESNRMKRSESGVGK